MNDQLTARLTLLKQEFAKGQIRLQEIEQQEVALRETLLRISGAIEVLEEIVGQQGPVGPASQRSADVLSSLAGRSA